MNDSNLNITYIGGGAHAWARKFICDLSAEPTLGGNIRLYDIDYQTACDNAKIGNMVTRRPESVGKWNYAAYTSAEEALCGSDFVIISILPGTFEEMKSDVHTPEKYGTYQSVGDTVGAGGIIRAMRTLPIFIHYAKLIQQNCPQAWVINYTNPMTVCVRALYEAFPDIKAFGCCHEVFSTQRLLAAALKEICGIKGVQRQEIITNVLGINHFTWIDSAVYQDMDLFPVYREFVERYYESGYEPNPEKTYHTDYMACADRVKFDLFRRYGVIACAGDRHLAEFVPGSWYMKDPQMVERWKFALTPVSWRIQDMEEKIAKTKAIVEGRETFQIQETGEEGVKLIRALAGQGTMVSNVNLPNKGQMCDVPLGAVVETNAVFSSNSVKPVQAGRLPDAVQALVIRHIYNQESVVKGIPTGDREQVFAAFVNDPQCSGLTLDEARKLFNKMVENTKKYL